MNKKVANVEEACQGIESGMTLMLGGFGLCGIPENSISEILFQTLTIPKIPITIRTDSIPKV